MNINLNKEEIIMRTETSKVTDETQIRTIIEDRVRAVGEKDSNGLLSNHATDILSFDVINPLQYTGIDTVRERAENWFSSYQSSIGYEVRDLNITASDSVAFCHFLYQISGTLNDGGKINMWVRATVCLSKIEDKWMIKHEHQSVPFDVETGKASLDLKP